MPTTLERIQYGFDRDSRRTWQRRELTTGEDHAYGYDGLSQVVQDARGNLNLNQTAISAVPDSQQNWDYAPTGNWRRYETQANGSVTLDQHRVHDKGNRLTQIEGDPSPILLDRAGRMRQVPPDAAGDWDESLELKWDAWGRITQVKRVSDEEVVGTYAYDGMTRRVTRAVDSVVQHSYYSDTWRPLEERKDSETDASAQYLWGVRHRDDLVRRDRDADDDGSLDETRYVLMDYFSPASIVDEEGAVTERYAFSAFGIRRTLAPDWTSRSVSERAFEFAFQGQFLDAESGLINYGFRYYSPFLGWWTCKDPLGERGGMNLYAMADNSPGDTVDYLGLLSCCDPKKVDDMIRQLSKRAVQKTLEVGYFIKRFEWCGVVCCNKKTRQLAGETPHTSEQMTPVKNRRGETIGWNQGSKCEYNLAYCSKYGPDWELAGLYHSHPDNTPLSPPDLEVSGASNVPIGLGTPDGGVKVGMGLPKGVYGPPEVH